MAEIRTVTTLRSKRAEIIAADLGAPGGTVIKHGTSRDAKWALMPTRVLDELIVDNCLW
jgi:hypothetical protein